MKVKATNTGYFGNARRRAGDVFEINSSKEFSSDWMEQVKEEVKVQKSVKPEAPRRAVPLSSGKAKSSTNAPTGSQDVI